jgi:hypothetical protein
MIEQRIVALINTNPTLSATLQGRIYPVAIRQDTAFPTLTYARLSSQRTYTFAGAGHTTTQIALTVWATEYATARIFADAIRHTLDAYTEPDDLPTPSNLLLAAIDDSADEYEPTLDVFGCTLQLTVQHTEEQP